MLPKVIEGVKIPKAVREHLAALAKNPIVANLLAAGLVSLAAKLKGETPAEAVAGAPPAKPAAKKTPAKKAPSPKAPASKAAAVKPAAAKAPAKKAAPKAAAAKPAAAKPAAAKPAAKAPAKRPLAKRKPVAS
ncbi:hypothetical protein OF829_15485 [Sphingomonas sp. LB-2]|uniref:hypothetical protein n=1 Tax=Sphingomonas caeni TaxID=2984949 RepID=UPI002230CE55|nr:hypothetical protein [Sphingomonas caeni]MCW3848637.1 hypothetical protein [Sphingomonas caeni]